MIPAIYHEQHVWQERQLHRNVRISPQSATRTVARFLARDVTMMAMAGTPTLILEETPLWQFPVILTIPKLGEVSTIGQVQVNALTGELSPPPLSYIEKMQALAYAIANHLTSATTE